MYIGTLGLQLFNTGHGHRVRKLVLNDVGPILPKSAYAKFAENMTREFENPSKFHNLTEVDDYVKRVYNTFGNLSEGEWRYLSVNSIVGGMLEEKKRSVSTIDLYLYVYF